MNIIKENAVNIPAAYSLYINIFNKLKIIILPDLCFKLNYKISVKLNYISLYKPLYNLSKIKLKIL